MCEQSAYLVFSSNVQIIDLFNLIYRIKNIETDRWLQIFFSQFIGAKYNPSYSLILDLTVHTELIICSHRGYKLKLLLGFVLSLYNSAPKA